MNTTETRTSNLPDCARRRSIMSRLKLFAVSFLVAACGSTSYSVID